MRRFVFLILLIWVSIVSKSPASASTHYQSPHTDLSYRFDARDDVPTVSHLAYRVPTDHGVLDLTIYGGPDRYSVTVGLVEARSSEIVTLTGGDETGAVEIAIVRPDRRKIERFVRYAGDGDFEPLVGGSPDCAAIAGGKLARVKRFLLERVKLDHGRYLEPPDHLEQLLGALYVARYVPLLSAGCDATQEPAAGGCYYDYADFNSCLNCCEGYAGISTVICMGGFAKICRAPWCPAIGRHICRGAVEFGSDLCAHHNCRGKLGDPGCDQTQPCEGLCLNFCGPSWSSGCGHCDEFGPNQQACCR